MWAAFRFGQREAAAATFILAASADWGMKHGHGPWARFDDPLRAVIFPQVFMITMAVMTLAMAAVLWERKRAEAEANEANRAKGSIPGDAGTRVAQSDSGAHKRRESPRAAWLTTCWTWAGKITLDRRPMNLAECARVRRHTAHAGGARRAQHQHANRRCVDRWRPQSYRSDLDEPALQCAQLHASGRKDLSMRTRRGRSGGDLRRR